MSINLITCENCGNDVAVDLEVCESCGAKLVISSSENGVDNTKSKDDNRKQMNTKKNKGKTSLKGAGDTKKVFSSTKIVYLVAFLLVIGSFLLTISGTFDTPAPVKGVGNSSENFDDVHQGVDMGSFQKIDNLETIVKNNPENYEALLELAHLLNDSQLNERAITYYKKYLTKYPSSADVIVDMGVCYYEIGQNDVAINTMIGALKFEPKHQIAHLNLGIVNMASNNHDAALEWFKKAVEINPNSNIGKRAKELLNQH